MCTGCVVGQYILVGLGSVLFWTCLCLFPFHKKNSVVLAPLRWGNTDASNYICNPCLLICNLAFTKGSNGWSLQLVTRGSSTLHPNKAQLHCDGPLYALSSEPGYPLSPACLGYNHFSRGWPADLTQRGDCIRLLQLPLQLLALGAASAGVGLPLRQQLQALLALLATNGGAPVNTPAA